jgi:hypothetical protein
MCTIGNVFSQERLGLTWNSVFKQCDLEEATQFIEPSLIQDGEIRYVPFTRYKLETGTQPAWAGVNEYGVCFVAADSYLPSDAKTASTASNETVFDMYLSLIRDFKCAAKAKDKAVQWYKDNFKNHDDLTDILLIADAEYSYFIEARGNIVLVIERTDKFFCSTNHLRMIYGAQPYEQNHSTYLRLQRAEAVLNANPSHEGVGNVLRDRYYGESVWSICRSNSVSVTQERPFYTQASVIFNVPQDNNEFKDVVVEYVISTDKNKPVCPSVKNVAKVWHPFSGTAKQTIEYIGQGVL